MTPTEGPVADVAAPTLSMWRRHHDRFIDNPIAPSCSITWRLFSLCFFNRGGVGVEILTDHICFRVFVGSDAASKKGLCSLATMEERKDKGGGREGTLHYCHTVTPATHRDLRSIFINPLRPSYYLYMKNWPWKIDQNINWSLSAFYCSVSLGAAEKLPFTATQLNLTAAHHDLRSIFTNPWPSYNLYMKNWPWKTTNETDLCLLFIVYY